MMVAPWYLASGAIMPADGNLFRISKVNVAKDKPDEPAPWCMTKSGPLPTGEVKYAWKVLPVAASGRKSSRSKKVVHVIGSSDQPRGTLSRANASYISQPASQKEKRRE